MTSEKTQLRQLLLERRDNTSGDLLEIAARKIQSRLKKIPAYVNAKRPGFYYSIGSEIPTQDIIQELLNVGRRVSLPKVLGSDMEFREIDDFASLERGSFGIMEPKDRCHIASPDVVLVPAVGVSPDGARLGYGHGFYDRFLEKNDTVSITLVLAKQLVRNIPSSVGDQKVDWIVTEDGIFRTSDS